MKHLPQTERIKIKLRLAKSTDLFLEMFGATSHQYFVDKPIKRRKVEKFEKTYNISLPEGYKTFLTEIGNGGLEYKKSVVGNSAAGPDYGIFKLGHPLQFMSKPALKYLEKEPFFNESTTEEEWEKIYDEMPEDISNKDYEKEIAKAYSGILGIGYSGCSGSMSIILNGKNKGRIIQTYDEIEYCPHFFKEANFLDWYESWLDSIISGEKILTKSYIHESEKEEDIVARFLSDIHDDYWQFKRLGSLRNFETLSDQSIQLLWSEYRSVKDEKQKHCLINFLSRFDYENMREELVNYAQNNPIGFLRNLHLYIREKTAEWLVEIERIKASSKSPEVAEYIKYITENDLAEVNN